MIFATVGTHHDGFPRMIDALDLLGDVDLTVQHGHGRAPANATTAAPFMAFPLMAANFAAAEIVITHAGVGSILLAIKHGHVPVVVPRQKRHREHVDDHQLELAEQMSARGLVRVAWEVGDLPAMVSQAPGRGPGVLLPETALHAAVRVALHGRAERVRMSRSRQYKTIKLSDVLRARRATDGLDRSGTHSHS